MSTTRWDETWHRLLNWTNGQAPSERLGAQILSSEGFEGLDPAHPLGGRDGGQDAVCTKAGKRWIMGVYFPRGQQSFRDIEEKFTDDLKGAMKNQAEGFAFVTNQELRLAERRTLIQCWPDDVELFHLERLTAILDTPAMAEVRKQFLGIDFDDRTQGGRGGDAEARSGGSAVGGTGGEAGPFGDGGRGGNAIAFDGTSLAIGGNGGRGGVGSGSPGGDTTGSVGDTVIGGDGGEAPQPDGRGGRGGRNRAVELLGMAHAMPRLSDGRSPGEGGRGANSPGYDGKVATVKSLLGDYYNQQPTPISFSDRHAAVPLDWLNACLLQMGVPWRVQLEEGEFTFVDCSKFASESFIKSVAETVTRIPSRQPEAVPKGISLITCQRIEWKEAAQNRAFPRDFTSTVDAFDFERFPEECPTFAAYVLVSGSGTLELSLRFDAPNQETLWERKLIAAHWGEIGAWECSLTVAELRIPTPGIYSFRLSYGNDVLLERPIVFRLREAKPEVPIEKGPT